MQEIENGNRRRQTTIKILASIFIGGLIICTLFSNTLLTMTLPKVATLSVQKGALSYTFTGNGTINPKQITALTQSAGEKVEKVYVKAGDRVMQGQRLISYDSSEAQWEIEDQQASLQKLKLAADDLQTLFKEANQNANQADINRARVALENNALDQELQTKKIQRLQMKLANNQELKAPFDGLIVTVNAKEGLSTNSDGPDVRIANESSGFELELQIPASQSSKLQIGESLEVSIQGAAMKVEGKITDMQNVQSIPGDKESLATSNSTQKNVHIAMMDKRLIGGEQAQVNVVKTAASDTLLIPHKAIQEDTEGPFVYTVEERKGPLGNAFYARKTAITVTDDDGKSAAVGQGLFDQSSIIMESSEPLKDGSRIRI
ncbi:efflux RND transporter periplasmic adaptor subunit [Paenibacillus qinlingensis]|uniref:RND family efflux transporter MFP subunit n=1 Tax=Paenibacillus qinlingensis TaxID=1837343 RepID=A0ABU1NS80_9BACL|nr:efflux RND transporter periplasmic adaptor subunit [Paenibacillus qinlingensis]MDR6550338.1 RND family efflux transporter MFP subunit [Paenibacillus qinlingensis]